MSGSGWRRCWSWVRAAVAALLYVITSGKTKLDPRHKMYPIHPPGPGPPVGTRGKTLICFVSLEQNERLLANRV